MPGHIPPRTRYTDARALALLASWAAREKVAARNPQADEQRS
jgi:hypothetical protein